MKNKTIKYYDSMGHPNPMVLVALENYLKEESMDKRKTRFDTSDWTLECVKDCPQQKNGSDCGVFSCQFAEFVSRDSSISFEQQHMPYIRRKMIYEIATGKLMLGF
jgi:sentrin-specific protease 1